MKKLLVALFICVFATPALAAPMYFTDRSAFNLAAGGSLNFESFETPFSVSDTQNFSDFSLSETGGINAVAHSSYYGFASIFVTEGSGAVWFDDNNNSVGTFAFNTAINAFGVDVTTTRSSSLTIGGDVSSSLFLTADQPSFFGVIDFDGLFDTLTFSASIGPNIGWDALAYGTAGAAPVPEPSTLLLLGGGLLGLGYFGRKRMKS